MSERISIVDVRTACGDGVLWADVDEKRGPMAVVFPASVLALIEVVEAAQRYFTASEAEAEAAGGIEGIEQNALNKLARFDFDGAA